MCYKKEQACKALTEKDHSQYTTDLYLHYFRKQWESKIYAPNLINWQGALLRVGAHISKERCNVLQ